MLLKRTLLAGTAGIALALGLFAGQAAAGEMMGMKTGDLNMDGAANSLDAMLVLQADAGLAPIPEEDVYLHAAGDVNCDARINSMDATLILQADAGLYEIRM
jgi:hypothetical protein